MRSDALAQTLLVNTNEYLVVVRFFSDVAATADLCNAPYRGPCFSLPFLKHSENTWSINN